MAFSFEEKTGNGSTHTYTFTFNYILKDHVKLFYTRDILANTQASTLVSGTDYNWTGDKTIQLVGSTLNSGTTTGQPYNLPNGTKLMIERQTPDSSQISTWQDGSNLTAEALNNADLQNLYVVQEVQDKQDLSSAKAIASETASNTATSNVTTLTGTQFKTDGSVPMTGNINANSNKVINVTDPTNAQDAVTKAYLERTGSIASAQILDGTIVDGDVNASAAISGSKLQASSGSNAGSMSSAHYTKLEGIEVSATADQTSSEIKSSYESNSDTNAYTDAEKTKLASCESNAKDDQTASEIKSLYESNSDTNGITDAEKTNIGTITNKQPLDSELTTLAGMQAATASKLAGGTALTSDIADLNQIDGLTKQTTISDSDASFPTSGAVVDYVTAQISPLGGLEVVATEVAFPNTQPASGVVISISDAGGVVINGSGVSTTGRTVGGATITINGFPSSLQGETLAAGVGLMVSSTGSSQTYNYHKILGKEDDIKQLSDDINDFNARYRVGSSNPSSALDAGDLFFNTSTSKLLVYNATNTAWEEAQSIGNFYISTLSPAFNGSLQDFTITNAPTNAEQILLSINGVIQKPNAGTSTPSEGFALTGSTVKLGAAPASTDTYFAVVIGSTVNIGTPSNNTVTESILQSNVVSEEKLKVSNSPTNGQFLSAQSGNSGGLTWAAVNTDLVADTSPQLGGNLDLNSNTINGTGNIGISGGISGQSFTTDGAGLIINAAQPTISLVDSDQNPDYLIKVQGGVFDIRDNTADVSRLSVSASGATLAGDIKFKGSGGGDDFFWDKSADQLTLTDSRKIRFGDSGDLEIYHDGASKITNATGALYIAGDDVRITNAALGETGLKFVADGAVELYHDNAKVFYTTAAGAIVKRPSGGETQFQITGCEGNTAELRLVADDGDDNADYWKIKADTVASGCYIQNFASGNWEESIQSFGNGAVNLYYDNSKKFETASYGAVVTGTFQATGNIELFDNGILNVGTGADLKIYHDSSNGNSFITESGSGSLVIKATNTIINSAADEQMISATADGAVELYHDNSKKFETTSAGARVTGNLHVTSNLLLEDNDKAKFGDSEDLEVYHNGTHSIIDEVGNGNLVLRTNQTGTYATVVIQAGEENSILANKNGSVELYYDSSKKFETGPGGTKFFNESIWGNAGSTDPWTATGDVAQGLLLFSEDSNVEFPIGANSNDTITCILNRTNGNGVIQEFKYNGSVVGSISSNASSLPSDRDFKTNISDLNLGLSLVNKLKPSQFNYKIDDANTPVMYGLIAQELEEAITSEGITKNSTQLIQHHPTDDTESNYDVDYSKLIPILINSIKELSTEVDTLKTKVAALESA